MEKQAVIRPGVTPELDDLVEEAEKTAADNAANEVARLESQDAVNRLTVAANQ